MPEVILINPVNGSEINTLAKTFVWSAFPNARYYRLQYDDNDALSSPVTKSTTRITQIINLTIDNKNYWWRVLAFNSSGVEIARSFTWSFFNGVIPVLYECNEALTILDSTGNPVPLVEG